MTQYVYLRTRLPHLFLSAQFHISWSSTGKLAAAFLGCFQYVQESSGCLESRVSVFARHPTSNPRNVIHGAVTPLTPLHPLSTCFPLQPFFITAAFPVPCFASFALLSIFLPLGNGAVQPQSNGAMRKTTIHVNPRFQVTAL